MYMYVTESSYEYCRLLYNITKVPEPSLRDNTMIITNRIVLNHTMNELNHQISNQTIKYHCTILLQIYVSSIYMSLIDVHTVKNE